MPITLTVEDGSGVANANSFATLAQARDFAVMRGVTLSNDDEVLKVLLIKATDWLKSKSYLGEKTYAGQSYLPWPRSGLMLDGEEFPENSVPLDIVNAAAQLCIEQANGITLDESQSGALVKKETVGPLSTEYVGSNRAATPRMPKVDALLEGWIVHGSGRGLRTVRV
jgi:hypothetical protein